MKYLSAFVIAALLLSSCGVLGPSSRSGQSDRVNSSTRPSVNAGSNASAGTDAGKGSGTIANANRSVSNDRSTSDRNSTEGIASWYGSDFHGKQTANGEIYDMNARTAAHRSLPFNTKVRVTNLINNLSVDVRINDRGPYIKDRVIDLSRAAAESIDMIGIGTAPVLVQVIGEGDRPVNQENLNSKEVFTVQLGSFSSGEDAGMRSDAIRGSRVVEVELDGQTYFRVYFKTFRTRFQAEEALRKLESSGFEGFVRQIDL
jgi:rare lipoprotein A